MAPKEKALAMQLLWLQWEWLGMFFKKKTVGKGNGKAQSVTCFLGSFWGPLKPKRIVQQRWVTPIPTPAAPANAGSGCVARPPGPAPGGRWAGPPSGRPAAARVPAGGGRPWAAVSHVWGWGGAWEALGGGGYGPPPNTEGGGSDPLSYLETEGAEKIFGVVNRQTAGHQTKIAGKSPSFI